MTTTRAEVIADLHPRGQCKICGRTVYNKSKKLPRSYYTQNGFPIAHSATRCEGCAKWEQRHPDQSIEQRQGHVMTDQKRDIGSLEWQESAACGRADPDLFDEDHPELFDEARRYCNRCPVVPECLEFALRNRESGCRGGHFLVGGRVKTPTVRKVAA